MAKGSVTALTLLDLSAAFNTIDHTIFLDRLHTFYGMLELALDWPKSYLSERTHSIKVGSILSHPAKLPFGMRRHLAGGRLASRYLAGDFLRGRTMGQFLFKMSFFYVITCYFFMLP